MQHDGTCGDQQPRCRTLPLIRLEMNKRLTWRLLNPTTPTSPMASARLRACVRAESGWKVGVGVSHSNTRAGQQQAMRNTSVVPTCSPMEDVWPRWACASLHLPPPPPRGMANAIERRAIGATRYCKKGHDTSPQGECSRAHESARCDSRSRLLGASTTSRHHFDTRKARAEAPHRAHGPG
jgi:hypothetical protein